MPEPRPAPRLLPSEAVRSANGHTYLGIGGAAGPGVRSAGPVSHAVRDVGGPRRVRGIETIRLHPDGRAESSLLGPGTWRRDPWGARLAFAGAEIVFGDLPLPGRRER